MTEDNPGIQEDTDDLIGSLHSVRDYLRWTMSTFARHQVFLGHGTDDVWDEALGLVLHALALPWNTDPNILDARLTRTERLSVIELVNKRVNDRVPLAYLTQKAWFADLEFFVDERVLIPRSPIAELIESQFAAIKPADDIESILDIGTGSGCIAIACAVHLPDRQVDAIDICESALSVARINVERHQVPVTVWVSDLFDQVEQQYDLIIANPPYVAEAELLESPAEYHSEPRSALVSAEAGMYHVKQLLVQAEQYLQPGGIMIVEVGYSQPEFEKVFPCLPVTWLEFSRGGQGVFIVDRDTLEAQRAYLAATV